MRIRVLTPGELLFEGEVESVTLPGTVGSFTVLDSHAPIISSLESGKVVLKTANGILEYPLTSGFAQVRNNVITVCLE